MRVASLANQGSIYICVLMLCPALTWAWLICQAANYTMRCCRFQRLAAGSHNVYTHIPTHTHTLSCTHLMSATLHAILSPTGLGWNVIFIILQINKMDLTPFVCLLLARCLICCYADCGVVPLTVSRAPLSLTWWMARHQTTVSVNPRRYHRSLPVSNTKIWSLTSVAPSWE